MLEAESALGAEVAEGARSLISVAPGAGDVEAALAPFDEPLDALLIPAAALASYGSDQGLGHVRLAVALLAAAATGPYGQVDPAREAILARGSASSSASRSAMTDPKRSLRWLALPTARPPSSPLPACDT